jgi:hypothetical protein
MDNSEFETRAFANPDDQSQDFLDAVENDPSRQQFLDDLRNFNARLGKSLADVTVPENMAQRLKDVAGSDSESAEVVPIKPWQSMQKLAMAASVVLVLGLTYSVLFSGSAPTPADLAFGDQVLSHIYLEIDEVNSSQRIDSQILTDVMSSVGGQLRDDSAAENLAVSFAKPCIIIPENRSAHFALTGNQGPINVIVVNNSPVQAEFNVGDSRFSGVVIPFEGGNLIIIGEQQESLDQYFDLLTENVEWVI